MTQEATCPKCDLPRPAGAEECPGCGIVYSRFDPRRLEARRAALAAVAVEANPYQAPAAAVFDPVRRDEAFGQPLATRGSRLLAQIVDSFVFFVVLLLVALPLMARRPGATADPEEFVEARLIEGCVLLLIGGLVLTTINLYLLARNGQTLGKKLCGIRIVRSDGDRAGLARLLFLRYMVPWGLGAIPYLGVLFSLTDTLFIFREDCRCLHDHIADTVVVVA